MATKMPLNATPENIGQVVSIQIIPREEANGDKLVGEKMIKVVGRLQLYALHLDTNLFVFKLEGDANPTRVDLDLNVVEIYVRSPF